MGTGNWLKVNLTGKFCHKDGIGSVVKITNDGQDQYKALPAGEGYLSQNSGTIHFGLGSNTVVDQMIIYWPDGTLDTFNGIAANQTINVLQAETLFTNSYQQDKLKVSNTLVDDRLKILTQDEILAVRLYSSAGILINYYGSQK